MAMVPMDEVSNTLNVDHCNYVVSVCVNMVDSLSIKRYSLLIECGGVIEHFLS